jgi:dipeptidyl aminopeptidase/acylaminoacyl peptidase
LAVAFSLHAGVGAGQQEGRPFTPEDMLAVRSFAGGQPVAIAPDGRWIAYVLTDIAEESNVLEQRPSGYVHVQPITNAISGRARALTRDKVHSAFPVWSPDATRLAFFREEPGGERLVAWDSQSDRMTPLGDLMPARAYLAPQWDPSGKRLIIATPARPDDPAPPPRVKVVRSTDVRIPGDAFFVNERKAGLSVVDLATGKVAPLLPAPVVLRAFRLAPGGLHLTYTAPSPETLGVIGKERNETFLVALAGGQPRKLTAKNEGASFSWSPDGGTLLFKERGRLMAMPVDGGDAAPFLPGLTAMVTELVWSPDGSSFASLVADPSVKDPELEPVTPGMYTTARPFMDVYLVSGADGTARNLTSAFPDQVGSPAWSGDGKALFFVATNNETYDETIYRYTIADGQLAKLAAGQESYSALATAPAVVSAMVEDATRPRDLWLFDIENGSRARITDLNPQLARFRFQKPELFSYHNGDGEKLGALLYRPAAVQPGEKLPVITWVYEKLTGDIHRFNARNQIFLTHGYAMLLPNVKVKVGQTGTSFVKSVVPAVDAVRAMGFTNGRFALWGHSFGAYATSYVITQTDTFACAVSGATPPELFRNWASGRDRDSRNIETGQARMGGSAFEVPERYLSQSAFFQLNKVNTPVMIMHGERDLTILFGEGEMMFYALRQLGKDAVFVAYANGDHSLSRHSRADTIDVNRRILEWFDEHLRVKDRAATR